MAGLVFLPDRMGADHLTPAPGIARLEGKAEAGLTGLVDRLVIRDQAQEADAARMQAWRGALAAALLLDAWEDCGTTLSVLEIDAHTSPFAALVLSSRSTKEREEPLHLILAEKEGEKKVLGVASKQKVQTLAKNPGNLASVLPERLTWYDRRKGVFMDPVQLLSERDRALLIRRLSLLKSGDGDVTSFVSDLAQEQLHLSQLLTRGDEGEKHDLEVRVKAAIGLMGEELPGLTVVEEGYVRGAVNPLLRLFTSENAQEDVLAPQRTYLWQGMPFARSSSVTGLMPTHHLMERKALEALEKELSVLERDSRRWQQDAARRIKAWLAPMEHSRSFLAAAREQITTLCNDLESRGAEEEETIVLTWPWDENSQTMRVLLKETLGETLAFAGSPFSERLTRFPGAAEAFGDIALRLSCRIGEDAYLPPLSQNLCECLYQAPQALAMDQIYLIPEEEGAVTATFLLRGEKEAALVRRYERDDITVMAEVPSVAVWPCVPFRKRDWRAYFVYLHGEGVEVHALENGLWKACCPEDKPSAVMQTAEYPACLTVYQGDTCLGALPNFLPAVDPAGLDEAVIALDVGATGTAVTIRRGESVQPLAGDCFLRTLLSSGDDAHYEDEFLPAEPIRGIVPTCAAVSGEGDSVLSDGRVYDPANVARAAASPMTLLSGSIKWRNDDAARRGRKMFLHQTMLTASLVCRLQGVGSVSWRMSLPDGTGKASRQAWLDMAEALAGTVAEESGLPLAQGPVPVSWAQESAALGAHLRERGMKGSFAAINFGGGSTGVHLWLRGQEKPVTGCSLHGGLQALLLGALAESPERLTESVAGCGDEALERDAASVAQQLARAKNGLQQMDRAMLMLDLLFAQHTQALQRHMNACFLQGRMTHLQALLMEHFAAAMLLTGLALEQTGKDSAQSLLLPQEITICLSGRGSALLNALPEHVRGALARFIRVEMREENPVERFVLYQSVEPKLDVCRGLCAMPVLGDEAREDSPMLHIGTAASFSALVMRFVLLERRVYPQVSERLHPEMFTDQGLLTVAGEDHVRRCAARHYGDGENIPAAFTATLADLRSN